MMNVYRTITAIVVFVALFLGIVGCATQELPEIRYDPAALRFDGEQAFATETELVHPDDVLHSYGEFLVVGGGDCHFVVWVGSGGESAGNGRCAQSGFSWV